MFFHYDTVLNSSLSAEEIETVIGGITKVRGTSDGTLRSFEGKVFNNGFTIYPIFDQTPRKQFRPEIQGHVSDHDEQRSVRLNFQLSSGDKILSVVILIFNVLVATGLFLAGFSYWWIVLAALAGFVGLALLQFHSVTAQSMNIFKSVLRSNETQFK